MVYTSQHRSKSNGVCSLVFAPTEAVIESPLAYSQLRTLDNASLIFTKETITNRSIHMYTSTIVADSDQLEVAIPLEWIQQLLVDSENCQPHCMGTTPRPDEDDHGSPAWREE